jgi:hypothetical protein
MAYAHKGGFGLMGGAIGFTLEPPIEQPPVKPRAIPAGTYQFTIQFSEKHQYDCPLLEAIPDFDMIEIHIGNFPADTLGCILVGLQAGTNAVYESREAFEDLMAGLTPGSIEIQESFS